MVVVQLFTVMNGYLLLHNNNNNRLETNFSKLNQLLPYFTYPTAVAVITARLEIKQKRRSRIIRSFFHLPLLQQLRQRGWLLGGGGGVRPMRRSFDLKLSENMRGCCHVARCSGGCIVQDVLSVGFRLSEFSGME